jgi:hypothetical protein
LVVTPDFESGNGGSNPPSRAKLPRFYNDDMRYDMERLIKSTPADKPPLRFGDKVRLLTGSPQMIIVDIEYTEDMKYMYFICALPGGRQEMSCWPNWLRRDKGRSVW